jgi:hypothetical protein
MSGLVAPARYIRDPIICEYLSWSFSLSFEFTKWMYEITMYLRCILTYFHDFSVFWIYQHRYQIGAFQEITTTFEIPPKIVSLQECLWHVDHMGSNHKSKGHKGRPTGPTLWLGSHTMSQLKPRLDGYAPKLVYKSIPGPRVGGDQEEWPASQVDGRRPSITSKPTQLSWWKLPLTSI